MRTRPWTMLLLMSGWINRHQQDVIEFLKEENKILKEKIGKKRILLNDNQKMRLAHIGKRLGRKVLMDISSTFSPDTILKWHRYLIARKYDGSGNRKHGRRHITEELEQLIVMLARKNKTWGSRRIKGALKHLGYKICHTTIDNVLKRNGYDPSPDRGRKTRWSEFLKIHWESLTAIDFFTTEIYTWAGITRYYVLVSIDYATRKVNVVGISQQPYGDWMKQMARNLTDPFAGFLKDKKYLIHDRDPLFTKEFRSILQSSGVKPIKTLPMAPHLNCIIERFIRSIKTESLDRMLIFGENHLRYIINEYMQHYHEERPHQGLNDEIIEPPPKDPLPGAAWRALEVLSEGFLMVRMNKFTLLELLITKLSEFNTVKIKKNQISKMYLRLRPNSPEIVPFISVLSIMSVLPYYHPCLLFI